MLRGVDPSNGQDRAPLFVAPASADGTVRKLSASEPSGGFTIPDLPLAQFLDLRHRSETRAETDAETHFCVRAERGAGREERGLELLRNATGTRAER